MKLNRAFFYTAAGLAITLIASAETPIMNVDPARHGNLASAQELVIQAFNRISEAQSANDSKLGGHAARAKELLQQANVEIGLAAETADDRNY